MREADAVFLVACALVRGVRADCGGGRCMIPEANVRQKIAQEASSLSYHKIGSTS